VILSRDQGERISGHLTIVAAREEIVITESLYPPGKAGPDPHIHRHHADCFYVLDGRLAFGVGPDVERVGAGPGTFVLVPPEVVHTFENEGPGEARFLNLHAPGCGFEKYLRDEAPWDSVDTPDGGGRPADEVVIRAPGAGVKASASDGIGSLSLVEVVLDRGPLPERRRDALYLIDGTLTTGSRTVVAGDYLEGESLSNPGDQPARLLELAAPA
jgi:mannose-6-phosphate isomerase-like protein (cupin superfamily)